MTAESRRQRVTVAAVAGRNGGAAPNPAPNPAADVEDPLTTLRLRQLQQEIDAEAIAAAQRLQFEAEDRQRRIDRQDVEARSTPCLYELRTAKQRRRNYQHC
jgi:hypothetical protein